MATDPWTLINRASSRDLAAIAIGSIGGIVFALGEGAIEAIQAGFALFVDPVVAVVDGAVALITSLYSGWVAIIEQGAATAVMSIAPGAQWAIGPLTNAIAIASVGAGLYVVTYLLAQPWTGNFGLGTIVDNRFISLIGETPEEEDDEN